MSVDRQIFLSCDVRPASARSWNLEELCYVTGLSHNVVCRWVVQSLYLNCCSDSMSSVPLGAGLVIYSEYSIPCGQVNLISVFSMRAFCSHALQFLLRGWQTWVFRSQWHQVSLFRVWVLLPLHTKHRSLGSPVCLLTNYYTGQQQTSFFTFECKFLQKIFS